MPQPPVTAGKPRQSKLRAVLLDLDGTLYRQPPLRRRMLRELLLLPLSRRSARSAARVWRRIHTYRRVREELRELGRPEFALADFQFEESARRLGESEDLIRSCVREWIEERPLRHLAACVRPGARELLKGLRDRGLEVGVFSDYPVPPKLVALGLREMVTLELCATDSVINAFKPHPAGFLHACSRWGTAPEEVLYVGDRVEVDAVGAAAAGMDCIICGHGLAPEYSPVRAGGEEWAHAVRSRLE